VRGGEHNGERRFDSVRFGETRLRRLVDAPFLPPHHHGGVDAEHCRPDTESRARSFGALAEQYERSRPGYPAEAVDWLLPSAARRVLDIGAGTGKLTRALLDRGLEAIAVEPDEEMLRVLAVTHPTADARPGRADALPVPDASADAVLAAQAWHWFPPERTVAEVRRVLRPGGRLGLVWNQAWPEHPWERAVERLVAGARGREVEVSTELPEVVEIAGLPSSELEAALFPWTELLDGAAVRARLATYSHVALLARSEREQLLAEAAGIVDAAATRSGAAAVAFRHTAFCVRWTPNGPAASA
jgi:SAM-dependent methyltransferase